MFSRSSSEDVKSRAKAGAAVAQSRAYQAKAAAVRAQELARQTATTQVAPLARSAQEKAVQRLLEARAWTAPRVEAGGVAVQDRLAPAVTSDPVFDGDGELVLFASIQCHHGDTGGAMAGGDNVFAKDFEILPEVVGRGRYLGSSLGVQANRELYADKWWGEEEVKIYLDGGAALVNL